MKDSMSTELTSGYKNDDITSDQISTAWNYLFVQVCPSSKIQGLIRSTRAEKRITLGDIEVEVCEMT